LGTDKKTKAYLVGLGRHHDHIHGALAAPAIVVESALQHNSRSCSCA
jgi:hypothetical protein